MDFSMQHPADQIVMIMNRIYHNGMTTTSGGNLSIMDNEGVLWISPSGIDKGNLRREDIMRVLPDGTIEGPHRPSVEYPIHASIYKQRPDFKAVLHAHPPSLVAISLVRRQPRTDLLPSTSHVCGDIRIASYALPGSEKLRRNITEQFALGADTVMMDNHGVVIGAQNLFEAFVMFETLDYAMRLEINASASGTVHGLTQKHMEIYRKKTIPDLPSFTPDGHGSRELALRRDMCTIIRRAYNNQLFTSGQGTFSCRLGEDDFVITPYAKDRNYLEPEDLVRIKDGKGEAGKLPSRSAKLHKDIYHLNPEVQSIIVAHPPHIMAFAITDREFDARLIPESYIALRNVRKLPFGSSILQTEMTARELSLKNPVVIVENDCVITVGKSLLDAFDKLEVLEYSAKSVLYTKNLGELVTINDEEVREIEEVFKL